MTDRIRTFIYGSCVSRDTFEHLPPSRFELLRYVARQSLISAYSPPVTLLHPPRLASPFQQRMADSDFGSDLPAILRQFRGSVDLVLWDLVDERLGVYLLPDDTALTRSVDLIAADATAPIEQVAQFEPFGTDAHFAMWCAAARWFASALAEEVPNAQIVLLAPPWATTKRDGAPAPGSFGLSAAQANDLYQRYYEFARHLAPVTVLNQHTEVLATSDHRWGSAPFHYTDDTYRALVHSITEVVDRSSLT